MDDFKIEVSKKYQHKNGDVYVVLDTDILTQENGVWVEAVLYKRVNNDDLKFTRTQENFKQSFKPYNK